MHDASNANLVLASFVSRSFSPVTSNGSLKFTDSTHKTFNGNSNNNHNHDSNRAALTVVASLHNGIALKPLHHLLLVSIWSSQIPSPTIIPI